jgi:beta-lactamase class A
MVVAFDATGRADASRMVTWREADLLPVSPFTRERLAEGASLRDLARAAQITSDNTAANVLLRDFGGPAMLTQFWRSIGDAVSRLDRYEPALNIVPVTEFRDTTTPDAMALTVARLIYGEALPEAARAELKSWMVATETGLNRVRAGLPKDWQAGDKTGTALDGAGGKAIYVDIGFAEGPRGAPPITFATYFVAGEAHDDMDPAALATLAAVGRVIKEFAEPERGLPLVGKLY